ncbi:MAG: cyclopropane fatty-acyl-phospholipid synthase-like methyltransferase [Psychroserpens sp.]|jgi:cyclopropane fatty-acyl-phospholipid synthase-like methyltransferase
MNLTDRAFWLNYWENKKNLALEVSERYILSSYLKKFKEENDIKSAIEIGGFPGYYSIYLKKWLNVDTTLLDYVIHPDVLDEVMAKNAMTKEEITLIETDLFKFDPKEKYDLVMSVGVIEHFADTKNIVEMHTKFMAVDGVLFVNIPNFTGFNGWLQRTFDPEIYAVHNISSMNIGLLKGICEELQLKNITVEYYGGFMMWLENLHTKSFFFKLAFKTTWFILKVISKIIPLESKIFSPYINIVAYK